MRRSLITVATTLSTAFALLPMASAQAEEVREPSVKVTPYVVKLVPTGKSTVTLDVDFGQCADDSGVDIVHSEGRDKGFQYRQTDRRSSGKVTVDFRFSAKASPGKWYVDLGAILCQEPMFLDADKVASFWVKRSTAITKFNATPEPVRKGGKLKVTGYFKRLEPYATGGPAYLGRAGVTVRIDFKPAGSSTWYSKGTVKTGTKGLISKTFTATKDGTWRAVYIGSPYYAPSSGAPDYVDVR